MNDASINTIQGLVSTIIPVYNRSVFLEEAVNSVLNQDYRPIEVIIIDDGSTDETPERIDLLAVKYPNIIKVIHGPNEGPGLAREKGRRIAKGGFIQYLDSDDCLLPNKFSTQINALNENQDCKISYGITHQIDVNGNILVEKSRWTGRKIDYLFPGLLLDRWWHTCTPLYRRDISDKAGPWLAFRPEDWDLEARMAAYNPKLIFSNIPLACYRQHTIGERVTDGGYIDYLKDEAIFIPRLYECAIRSGVKQNSMEMKTFFRWVFLDARRLASSGELELASSLLTLSKRITEKYSIEVMVFELLSRVLGLRVTGKLSEKYDGYRNNNNHVGPDRVYRHDQSDKK